MKERAAEVGRRIHSHPSGEPVDHPTIVRHIKNVVRHTTWPRFKLPPLENEYDIVHPEIFPFSSTGGSHVIHLREDDSVLFGKQGDLLRSSVRPDYQPLDAYEIENQYLRTTDLTQLYGRRIISGESDW